MTTRTVRIPWVLLASLMSLVAVLLVGGQGLASDKGKQSHVRAMKAKHGPPRHSCRLRLG